MVDETDSFSENMFSEDATFEKLKRQRQRFQRRYDPDRDPFLQRSSVFKNASEVKKDGGGNPPGGVVSIIRRWADR
jgi:hypothetical protein